MGIPTDNRLPNRVDQRAQVPQDRFDVALPLWLSMPPHDGHARRDTFNVSGFNLTPTAIPARDSLDAADCRFGLLPRYTFIITLTREDGQRASGFSSRLPCTCQNGAWRVGFHIAIKGAGALPSRGAH
jgi:hypothetical protein